MSFEQSMARLDEILKQLSDGTVTLEKSLSLYSEGVALIDGCTRQLNDAKLTIERLQSESGVSGLGE